MNARTWLLLGSPSDRGAIGERPAEAAVGAFATRNESAGDQHVSIAPPPPLLDERVISDSDPAALPYLCLGSQSVLIPAPLHKLSWRLGPEAVTINR